MSATGQSRDGAAPGNVRSAGPDGARRGRGWAPEDRTALVTGVSGHVAGAMADRLRAGGLRVRALVRTPAQASLAARSGWQPVHGDLGVPRSLAAAVDGADLVVHAAAYLGQDRALAAMVNVDGTRSLAEAALKAGVRRFVHISTMSVHGEPQPDGLHEDSPLAGAGAIHPYVATKAMAEHALREVGSRGLETVILRPGAICTVLNSQWGDLLVARLRGGDWPANRHPGDIIPWVHTDDLAEMTWLAATQPAAAGETFLAVDRNVAISDYFVPITEALGRAVTAPDREPVPSRCRIGKIHTVLGYRPQRTFEHTLRQLLTIAGTTPTA